MIGERLEGRLLCYGFSIGQLWASLGVLLYFFGVTSHLAAIPFRMLEVDNRFSSFYTTTAHA